jgi:hypothetical protein
MASKEGINPAKRLSLRIAYSIQANRFKLARSINSGEVNIQEATD